MMRICRLFFAVLLAMGLATLPISAAVAMTYAAKAEMGMSSSADDCPCCKPAQLGTCLLKCCHIQAISADSPAAVHPLPPLFPEAAVELGTAVSFAPDPPPPRS
jgi:hypothetical protein